MRFISKDGRLGVQIRPMIQEAYATGMAKVVQEPLYAQFEPWLLSADERELAINHWVFNGFYQMEDEVTIVPPDYRIGLFDSVIDQQTKGYSDEERLMIEKALVENAALTDNIIVVPATFYAPPWPNYDDYAGGPASLVRKLVEEGHSLEAVLDYERANQNRDKVVEGLEELIRNPDGAGLPEEVEVLG